MYIAFKYEVILSSNFILIIKFFLQVEASLFVRCQWGKNSLCRFFKNVGIIDLSNAWRRPQRVQDHPDERAYGETEWPRQIIDVALAHRRKGKLEREWWWESWSLHPLCAHLHSFRRDWSSKAWHIGPNTLCLTVHVWMRRLLSSVLGKRTRTHAIGALQLRPCQNLQWIIDQARMWFNMQSISSPVIAARVW